MEDLKRMVRTEIDTLDELRFPRKKGEEGMTVTATSPGIGQNRPEGQRELDRSRYDNGFTIKMIRVT